MNRIFRHYRRLCHTKRTNMAEQHLYEVINRVKGMYGNELYEAEQELISAFEEEEYLNKHIFKRIRKRLKERA